MARAFPDSAFAGSRYHDGSIQAARGRAQEAGVAGRVSFGIAPGAACGGTGFDLVTMSDCLHEVGDPAGAARHVRGTLEADGTWMIVEPHAGDRVEENLNPVGPACYGFSALLCTPASLWQEVGLRSASRPVRRGSRKWSMPAASPGSAGLLRHRSTSSSKRAPDHPDHRGTTVLRWPEPAGRHLPAWRCPPRVRVLRARGHGRLGCCTGVETGLQWDR
jgi:hypothetical protein